MLDELANDGLAYLNETAVNPQTTVIIVGAPRSGTSMPAAVLYRLGMFMGDEIRHGTYEDQRIALALEKEPERLAEVIAAYNRHSIWAFKRPMAYTRIEEKLPLFRNPRIVAMFRDPVAIAKRDVVSMEKDFGQQLKAAMNRTHRLVEFVLRQQVPVMVISYEKAVASPTAFVKAIAGFAGLQIESDAIEKATIAVRNGPEHYLLSSQTRFPEFTGKAPRA